jgi:hypothetical protein
MALKRVAAVVAAAYYVLFESVTSLDSIQRHRAPPRSDSRLRNRQRFDGLQTALSSVEFARAVRMTHTTFLALLALLEGDKTRDMRIATSASGGKVEPAVRHALTVRMLSGARISI